MNNNIGAIFISLLLLLLPSSSQSPFFLTRKQGYHIPRKNEWISARKSNQVGHTHFLSLYRPVFLHLHNPPSRSAFGPFQSPSFNSIVTTAHTYHDRKRRCEKHVSLLNLDQITTFSLCVSHVDSPPLKLRLLTLSSL